MSIADALRGGGKVTVVGNVTAGPSLLDASGRLVVIQDSTAAVEVRLPASGSSGAAGLVGHPPVPGVEVQVSGSVGRAYGAPRISATSVTWLGTAAEPQPLPISAAPGLALEWRVVKVSGRLDTVHRLGLRWRADLIDGSVRIPIVGLIGAQIAVGRLFVGRRVTVIGIVRRAYPTALDQRLAIEPRSLSDVAFDRADPALPSPTRPSRPGGTSSGSGVGVDPGSAGTPSPSGEPTVDLSALAAYRGRLVRVAGLVTGIDRSIVSLDDGSAVGRLTLAGAAVPFLDLIEIGDPLEVVGTVDSDAAGWYLLVTDPSGLSEAGDPSAGSLAAQSAAPVPTQASAPAGSPGVTAGGQIDPDRTLAGSDAPRPSSELTLIEGLAAALFGAFIAVVIALVLVRRGTRLASPLPVDEGPRARPTLGPS